MILLKASDRGAARQFPNRVKDGVVAGNTITTPVGAHSLCFRFHRALRRASNRYKGRPNRFNGAFDLALASMIRLFFVAPRATFVEEQRAAVDPTSQAATPITRREDAILFRNNGGTMCFVDNAKRRLFTIAGD